MLRSLTHDTKYSDEQTFNLNFKFEANQNFKLQVWVRFFCHVMLHWNPHTEPNLYFLSPILLPAETAL